MGRLTGKTSRFIVMVVLTTSFFVVELVTGHITRSLALVSDSYHMLSDVAALIIGLVSLRLSKRTSPRNTYGWARAEVLGALVNAVFLLVLCFTIFVEAVQRLIEREHVENPDLMLIVGGLGLLVNILGMLLFHGHGHSHGGHGHSHGDHGHSHDDHGHSHGDHEQNYVKHGHSHEHDHSNSEHCHDNRHHTLSDLGSPVSSHCDPGPELGPTAPNGRPSIISTTSMGQPLWRKDEHRLSTDAMISPPKTKKSKNQSSQMNMHGVFLHVLGDFLGSVVVVVSSLIIKFVDASWVEFVDPLMSMIIVFIIVAPTVPLFRDAAYILMQATPIAINTGELERRLLLEVENALAVHELHVWQLAGSCYIASAHVLCPADVDMAQTAREIKDFFHRQGIHSSTVQQELVGPLEDTRACVLECGPSMACHTNTCCKRKSDVTAGQTSDDITEEQTAIEAPASSISGSACDVTTLSNVHDFGSSPRDESRSQSPHSWESLPSERNTEDYSNGVTQPGSSGGCKNQAYIVNELDGNANNSNKQGEIGHSTTSSDNRDVGYDQPHFSDVSERSSQTLSERNESSPTASGHAVDFSNDFVHTENSISCV